MLVAPLNAPFRASGVEQNVDVNVSKHNPCYRWWVNAGARSHTRTHTQRLSHLFVCRRKYIIAYDIGTKMKKTRGNEKARQDRGGVVSG